MKKAWRRFAAVACVAVAAAAGWQAYRLLTRPAILFVGFNDQLVMLAKKASAKSGIRFDEMPREMVDRDGGQKPDLKGYRVVVVNGLRAEPYPKTAQQAFQEAVERGAKVLVVPPRQSEVMRIGNADYQGRDQWVAGYFNNGGVENWTRLLRFLSANYAGAKLKPEPPLAAPEDGFYHPDAEEVFTTSQAYKAWYASSGREKPGRPWVALDFAQGWRIGITQGTDGLIRAFERRNFNVAPMFGQTHFGRFLEEIRPDLIINRSHGRFYQGEHGVELLAAQVQAPVIRGLSLVFEQKTVDEYRQTKDGVRGPGLAVGTVVSELDGAIEPLLIEGLERDKDGRRVETVIAERVEKLIDRAERWIALRKKTNAEKRIAVIYFNGIGKAAFTAAGLNVPASLVRFLDSMAQSGYQVSGYPPNPEELLKMMQARGRNVSEAEAGEMERLAGQAGVTLLPAEGYAAWFAKLPATLQKAVTEAYGPAPGSFMTVRRDGKDFFVIPALQFGSVTLLPQPARGARMDAKLQHSDKVPPPHQYLAVYWWLQDVWRADALVHYGTHGTYEFLPGRPVGQLDDDWSDRVVGALPNVYVYTMDNVGEALIAKRRGSAVLVSYQTPPIQAADLQATDRELAELSRETRRFLAQEPGSLKESMRSAIREMARKRKLDADLKLDWSKSAPADEQIRQLDAYLHELDESRIPVGMHIHGAADKPEDLRLTITEILGKEFLARHGGDRKRAASHVGVMMASSAPGPSPLASVFSRPLASTPGTGQRQYAMETQPAKPAPVASGHPAWIPKIGSPPPEVRARMEGPPQAANSAISTAFEGPSETSGAVAVSDQQRVALLKAAFAESAKEIEATLRALDGKYVRPGAGGDPVRTPSALPTGRNLYGVNPAEIPTRSAWEAGVELSRQLLEAEKKRLGRYPRKIGFNLWPTELVRQYGTDLAQALYLMGVKPVWDQRGIIIDLEVIPMAELKRPRVDVVIQAAGQFRDSFPDRMELLDKAVRLAALANDGENFVASGSAELERELKESGLSAKEARQLANARIFSNSPGGYGTGLTGGIAQSGAYTDTKELSRGYLERAGAVYTQGAEWGKKVPKLYERALKGTDAVSISHSSNTISALTLDHYFEYSGGMVMAIRDTTGKNAAAYMADVRDPVRTRMQTVDEALAADLRTKMWNRKWIAGMKENDFSGAAEIAELANNLYGWQVTKPDAVQGHMWDEIYRIYVEDPGKTGIREWFDKKNPHAYQNLTAAMLETARKGYWKPDTRVLRTLAGEYARSVAVHGSSGGERTTGNAALQQFVRQRLNAPGDQPGQLLTQSFNKALERAAAATQKTALVAGQKLSREMSSQQAQQTARTSLFGGVLALVLASLAYAGYRRRAR